MAIQLNTDQLRQFAPHSPILAFRPATTGSPMQDWCRHLERNPNYRRELEEFALLGDVVLRIVDGTEPDPFERVRILSLEYAMKVLEDETDAKEFVRCVRAIASPDAGQYEYEQIAAFYYGEIRRRSRAEVLGEMGLLGMQMEAVTKTLQDREIYASEPVEREQKLSVADQRRLREIAPNRPPLPERCPNFDEELAAVIRRVGRTNVTRMVYDDFAEFMLADGDKTVEELDADFIAFEKLEQYDENGIIGFAMNSGQRSQVVFDFEDEVDVSYLPADARSLGRELNRLFVGHRLGGDAAREARRFIIEHQEALQDRQMDGVGWKTAPPAMPEPPALTAGRSEHPLSDAEFNDWLWAKLDCLYPNRVERSVRRIRPNRLGTLLEYVGVQTVNPDYEEMQYVAAVCQILWARQRSDFHLRSLRRKEYQDLYLEIRATTDTAEVAALKKEAYARFKHEKTISLKEFTALNTVAKSQEARLSGRTSEASRKWLAAIERASPGRLRYIKFSLYNDDQVKSLTRQEKQRLWDAVRVREAAIAGSRSTISLPFETQFAHPSVRQQNLPKQYVRVTPRPA